VDVRRPKRRFCVIASPDTLARQTISVTAGSNQLYFQLNNGGKWEVLPDSPNSFFLLSLGGLEFSCRFVRNPTGKVSTLLMDGSGLQITARRVD